MTPGQIDPNASYQRKLASMLAGTKGYTNPWMDPDPPVVPKEEQESVELGAKLAHRILNCPEVVNTPAHHSGWYGYSSPFFPNFIVQVSDRGRAEVVHTSDMGLAVPVRASDVELTAWRRAASESISKRANAELIRRHAAFNARALDVLQPSSADRPSSDENLEIPE